MLSVVIAPEREGESEWERVLGAGLLLRRRCCCGLTEPLRRRSADGVAVSAAEAFAVAALVARIVTVRGNILTSAITTSY